jgi:dihydrofolate reductase
MRKLTAGLFTSVDGVVESPNLFQGDYFDAELGAGMGRFMAQVTTAGRGELGWNARLIEGDVAEALTALKRTEGGDIAVFASISLARQLLFAGVLDELTLMVHPVVAGAGRRLFEPDDPMTRLELVGSEITSRGNAVLTYARRD